jgi:hypothetical protein
MTSTCLLGCAWGNRFQNYHLYFKSESKSQSATQAMSSLMALERRVQRVPIYALNNCFAISKLAR